MHLCKLRSTGDRLKSLKRYTIITKIVEYIYWKLWLWGIHYMLQWLCGNTHHFQYVTMKNTEGISRVVVIPYPVAHDTIFKYIKMMPRLCFYQTGSAWSMDQGSTRQRSAVHDFAPTVTKFCVMWEGQALPHDTKFGNCRCEIVGRRVIFIWSLIHGSSWSGLIKAEPG